METVTTREVPFGGTEVVEPTARPRVSWGSVFAGGVVALGVWAMLYALGLAVGLSALDPMDPSTLKSSGIFSGIWGVFAPLVALFVGGLVVGRCSGVVKRMDAALHGMVMWGLATITGVWLVAMFMATLIGGAASFGRTALQAEVGTHRETATQQRASRTPMAKGEGMFDELRKEFTGVAPTSQETLAKAEGSAKAFGGMFGALFLGMVSAMAGATVGLRRRRPGKMVTTTTTTAEPTPEAPPLATQREAYP